MTDKIVYASIPFYGSQYNITFEMVVKDNGTVITGSTSGYGDITDVRHDRHFDVAGVPVIDFSTCTYEQIANVINADPSVQPSNVNKEYTGTVETWVQFCKDNGATIYQW